MTYAFRAFAPEATHAEHAGIGRCEFFAWIACVFFIADLGRIEVARPSEIIPTLVDSVTSRSVFYYLGIYAVIRLLLESNASRKTSRWDVGLGLAACLLAMLPFKSVDWVLATAWAIYLYATSGSDRKAKAAAVVLLAIAANNLWGPVIFDVFEATLLRIDAALTGTALVLSHTGLTWHGNIVGAPGGHRIIILSGCSSFHNISMGLLCWTALTKLARPTWIRADLPFALGVVGAVILLNVARLYLMALSADDYFYWHSGFGSQLYAMVTTLAVLVISLWSVCRNSDVPT